MTHSAGQQPPGWYHAHGDPSGTQRFWDGTGWVGAPRPGPGSSNATAVNIALPIPRIAARVIDWILWLAIRAGAAAFIGYVAGSESTDTWLDRALIPVLGVILISIYEISMVARSGATVGKMAMGLKVVDNDGTAVDLSTAMLRVLPLLVAGLIEAFLFGRTWWLTILGLMGFLGLVVYSFVMLFADSSRRTPWDRLAGTLVARR
ncbi:MAG: RDD family protein [Acidimicrobiia bacterium]|nr:RDD family protein [Acidimicrobiia bacterium]